MSTTGYSDLLPGVSENVTSRLLAKLDHVARSSVVKDLGDKKIDEYVVSYSGGIDSSILSALALSLFGNEVSLFSVARMGSRDGVEFSSGRDLAFADRVLFSSVSGELIEDAAKQVSSILGFANVRVSHLEDCIAFHLIAKELQRKKPHARYIVTANGPDELFCGYDRYRRIYLEGGLKGIELEIPRALKEARDLKKAVRAVIGLLGFETLDPFLSDEFVTFSKDDVPLQVKLNGPDDRLRKRLWRAYGRLLGLGDTTVLKPKRAMQYSMGIHAIVSGMLRRGELVIENPKIKKA